MHLGTSYPGIYRGIVKDTNDPNGLGRIRLVVPQIFGEEITGWAYPIDKTLTPIANKPTWVMFEGGDPNFPLWLGTF
jgi:hypothetical protein